MCFNCGLPQWRQVHTAPPPTKEEHIFVDGNTAFYPDYRQGIHPPGPVYQNSGQYAPYMYGPSMYTPGFYNSSPQYYMQPQASFCVGQQFCFPQTGWRHTSHFSSPCLSSSYPYPVAQQSRPTYYTRPEVASQFWQNAYSPLTRLTAPGYANPAMISQWQYPADPNLLTAQAAAAAENNARLASMPNAPAYLVGMTPAEIAAQKSICGHHCGMTGGMGGCMHTGMAVPTGQMMGTGQATTVAPYKPGEASQFWCRELDGSWTLRNYSEICLGEVSPGHWEKHAVSGYFFWVRQIS